MMLCYKNFDETKTAKERCCHLGGVSIAQFCCVYPV